MVHTGVRAADDLLNVDACRSLSAILTCRQQPPLWLLCLPLMKQMSLKKLLQTQHTPFWTCRLPIIRQSSSKAKPHRTTGEQHLTPHAKAHHRHQQQPLHHLLSSRMESWTSRQPTQVQKWRARRSIRLTSMNTACMMSCEQASLGRAAAILMAASQTIYS